jgi:hypothetical protein
MQTQSLVLYLLIIGCEVGFWLVLLLGLAVRYVLKKEAPSRWLLRSLPLIDVLLLVFTAWDLRAGTPATFAHGLAAAYIGFTIAFGSTVIRWADANFAYRFASGPAPEKAPTRGWKAVRFELELWLRCIGACVIALGLIEALIAYVGNDTVTQPLNAWHRHAFGCVFFWFIFGPLWSLVFFRREAR